MPLSTHSTIVVLTLSLLLLFPVFAVGQNGTTTATQAAEVRIIWEGKPKIARYRLQLARDEKFRDIVFDKVVEGREYKVTEVAPGNYFWRVAPSAKETAAFSKPLAVQIPVPGVAEETSLPKPVVISPPADVGWRTATGSINQPIAARIRKGPGSDVIGVNAYGMVYAISGDNGVALWSARYRPDAKKGEPTNSDGSPPFTPLLVGRKDKAPIVVVAFDGGLRGLDGSTGRELWRAPLPSEAIVGATLDPEPDESTALAVFDNSHTLTFIKGETGQPISQTKLEGEIVGRPVALDVKGERGLLVGLNNGILDVRNMAGVSMLSIRLDSPFTSSPMIVRGPRGQLVMLGTEAGLIALDAASLNPIWRVVTEADAPQGIITSTDLDADSSEEVVLITRRGRVVVVNVGTGKIKWVADGATNASSASFADLNGDGITDVLVAGGSAFALGFSGKDGVLIWKADESQSGGTGDGSESRRIVVAASFGTGGLPLLVGTDAGRTGLRAVGLPAGAVK